MHSLSTGINAAIDKRPLGSGISKQAPPSQKSTVDCIMRVMSFRKSRQECSSSHGAGAAS